MVHLWTFALSFMGASFFLYLFLAFNKDHCTRFSIGMQFLGSLWTFNHSCAEVIFLTMPIMILQQLFHRGDICYSDIDGRALLPLSIVEEKNSLIDFMSVHVFVSDSLQGMTNFCFPFSLPFLIFWGSFFTTLYIV